MELFRYRLPLTAPIALRGFTLYGRTGLLIRLQEDGLEGWGEAAPLAGFSTETEEEALEELSAVRDSPGAADAFEGQSSSVRFAIESAQLDLQAQRSGVTMAEIMHPKPRLQLPLNALVASSGESAIAEAAQRVGEGYQTLKLKVGRSTVDEDIRMVAMIREAVPESVKIRLDANQAWTFAEAKAFGDGAGTSAIDYIEEPLAEPTRLREFAEATGMPVALDESLVGMAPGDLSDFDFAAAIVLKASIGGGLNWALRMIEEAREVQILPVVSSAFESGVGLRTLVALAAAQAAAPAGLTTYRWLADDVYADRLPLDAPIVDAGHLLSPRTPDVHKLERIL